MKSCTKTPWEKKLGQLLPAKFSNFPWGSLRTFTVNCFFLLIILKFKIFFLFFFIIIFSCAPIFEGDSKINESKYHLLQILIKFSIFNDFISQVLPKI